MTVITVIYCILEVVMDWAQCLTIIASTGALFWFTRKDMQVMDKNHREDRRISDERWYSLLGQFHVLDNEVKLHLQEYKAKHDKK